MNDLSFLSIPELGTLLRSRGVSAAELTEHFLGRLERLGPTYNAVVTVLREPAMAEARLRDRELAAGKIRGPLHGIPYGVKDLLASEGAPTTWGAEPYRNQMLKGDATVVPPWPGRWTYPSIRSTPTSLAATASVVRPTSRGCPVSFS